MREAEEQREWSLKYRKNMDRLRDASRIARPNKEWMSALVEKAKGAQSMRSFAERLDVNVSTVSRIISGQAETVSIELIAKIAACSLGSGVTLKDLMEAQGLAIVRIDQNAFERFVRNVRSVIADELINRGYSVKYLELKEATPYERAFDFGFYTNALSRKTGKWFFDAKLLRPDVNEQEDAGIYSCINEYMAYYFQGGEADRISMVVASEDAFNRASAFAKKIGTIPDEISILLIDLIEGRVEEEYVLLTKGDGKAKKIF